MTARGKQWTAKSLPIEEVREHRDFQLRAAGVDQRHATKLFRELQAGKQLPPVRVAAVGKAYYLVDGFHRLEAHRRARRPTIVAEVARMSLLEAREASQKANTDHGLNLNRKDKQRLWDAFVAAGRHQEADGTTRPARAIEADLGGTYSRETIRQKLKAMGLELNEGEGFKTWRAEEVSEEELAAERVDEAEGCLRTFGALVPTLDPLDRDRLVSAARELVASLGRGEDGSDVREAIMNPLDI